MAKIQEREKGVAGFGGCTFMNLVLGQISLTFE